MLTGDCVMSCFDPSTETQLRVDASPLGAVLLQVSEDDLHPIAYADRTLTDVERRYLQTERGPGGRLGVRVTPTCLVKNLSCTPTTKRLRLSTVRDQSPRLELNDGLCVYIIQIYHVMTCLVSKIHSLHYETNT